MHKPFFGIAASCIALSTNAQYGTYDKQAVAAAKATSTIVVLDDGDSPYNRVIMDAMKGEWKFTNALDFINLRDLATRPITPAQTYLLKTVRDDPEKHKGTYITLAAGWKQKKGESLTTANNAVTNLPASQELVSLLIDPVAINEGGAAPMVLVYVKFLQDYLKQVENGKITDRTTADRLYQSRNRLVRDDAQLCMAVEHLDKTLPDAAKVKEAYPKGAKVTKLGELMNAVSDQDRNICVTDVVMTGDYKTKWCFKRIFNAGTGELMYLRDDAALYGKKEGFLDEDLKQIDRAR